MINLSIDIEHLYGSQLLGSAINIFYNILCLLFLGQSVLDLGKACLKFGIGMGKKMAHIHNHFENASTVQHHFPLCSDYRPLCCAHKDDRGSPRYQKNTGDQGKLGGNNLICSIPMVLDYPIQALPGETLGKSPPPPRWKKLL